MMISNQRLEEENKVLRDALHWARATFDLSDLPHYGDGIDQLLARYKVEPLGGARPHDRREPLRAVKNKEAS